MDVTKVFPLHRDHDLTGVADALKLRGVAYETAEENGIKFLTVPHDPRLAGRS